MDSMTLVAVVSIAAAGLTTGIGCMCPALGEGRAVATALTSLAHTDPVRRSGDDRVTGHLLLRGLDDSHFCEPVLESRHRSDRREMSHAHRLVHRRGTGTELPHPGMAVEAFSLHAHPQRHRRPGKTHCH